MKLFSTSKSLVKYAQTNKFSSFNKFPIMLFSSHLSQIRGHDEVLAQKFLSMDVNSASISDFSNFMRYVNKHPDNEELLKKFSQTLPNLINQLDYLDTRKAISIVLANPQLHNDEQLLSLVKIKFSEIRNTLGKGTDTERLKIGANLSDQPYSVRFWAGYARLRERVFLEFRKNGINLK